MIFLLILIPRRRVQSLNSNLTDFMHWCHRNILIIFTRLQSMLRFGLSIFLLFLLFATQTKEAANTDDQNDDYDIDEYNGYPIGTRGKRSGIGSII